MPNTRKTIYISDFHMTDADSFDAKPYAYGKMNADRDKSVAEFLCWIGQRPSEFERVVLLGDILDLWTVPHYRPCPTVKGICNNPQNQPVIKALGLLPKAGIEVIFVPGNHDNNVMFSFSEGMKVYDDGYSSGPILALHGHEHCLFNGPDPFDRDPLGYFITRSAATYTMATGHGFPSETDMLLKDKKDLLKLPREGVSTLVWNAVVKQAGLSDTDQFCGTGQSVARVRSDYAKLYAARRGNAEQILSEFDPFYSCFGSGETIAIRGHSHKHVFSIHDGQVYINVGAWLYETESFFAATWEAKGKIYASLVRWDAKQRRTRQVNTGYVDVQANGEADG